MKLDKSIVQRRLDLMQAEGVVSMLPFTKEAFLTSSQTFIPNANVGVDIDVNTLRSQYDALVVCTGATWPRDLKIPNRQTDGIHFAMEYLQVSVVSSDISGPRLITLLI
jgi:glutamate synthase (NADPH/NADH)